MEGYVSKEDFRAMVADIIVETMMSPEVDEIVAPGYNRLQVDKLWIQDEKRKGAQ